MENLRKTQCSVSYFKIFNVWQLSKWKQPAYDKGTSDSIDTLMLKAHTQGYTVSSYLRPVMSRTNLLHINSLLFFLINIPTNLQSSPILHSINRLYLRMNSHMILQVNHLHISNSKFKTLKYHLKKHTSCKESEEYDRRYATPAWCGMHVFALMQFPDWQEIALGHFQTQKTRAPDNTHQLHSKYILL